MPDQSRRSLFGRITHVERRGNKVIPAGSLTVSLNRPISQDAFKILPEVAAQLTTSITAVGESAFQKEGQTYTTCLDDTLRLNATLITPAGDTLLQNVRDPRSIDVSATKGQEQIQLSLSPSGQSYFHEFTAPTDTTTISVTAKYPGYFNFKSGLYTLKGVQCQPPRALSLDTPDEPWSAAVTKVPQTPPLRAKPMANGKLIPAQKLDEWSLEVVSKPAALNLAVQIDTASGGWTMRPTLLWGLPQLTSTGTFPVTVKLSSPRPNEDPIQRQVQFNIRDVSFWTLWGGVLLFLLALVILLVYLYGIYTKPRFPSGSYIAYREKEDDPHERDFELPTHWANRYLVPFTPETTEVGYETVTFRAHRSQQIILPTDQQIEGMKIGGSEIQEPGLRDEPLYPGSTLTKPHPDRTPTYEYHNT
jgi:hypothetical protein